MNEEEKLNFYIEKLRVLALEKLEDKKTTALQALQQSLHYIEGEMKGY